MQRNIRVILSGYRQHFGVQVEAFYLVIFLQERCVQASSAGNFQQGIAGRAFVLLDDLVNLLGFGNIIFAHRSIQRVVEFCGFAEHLRFLSVIEHFCNMHHLLWLLLPVQAARDVHDATCICHHQRRGPRFLQVADLALQELRGKFGMRY